MTSPRREQTYDEGPGAGGRSRVHPPGHSLRHFLDLGRHARPSKLKWVLIAVLLALAAALGVFLFLREFEWQQVTVVINRFNPLIVLPLMAVLPVVGFPIMFVYLFAGARFGPLYGGLVVAGITAVHLIATYFIAGSFLRKPLERFIARRHRHLPQVPPDEAPAVALVAALVPGLPYVVRNYALALAGVRFRVYFWVCLPVYVARSYVTIMLGDLSSDPSRRGLVILVIVDVLKVAVCALVLWWLRQHHRKYHGHDAPAAAVPPSGAAP